MNENNLELNILHQSVMNCRLCGLCETRTKAVPGEGPVNASIMFVGEAPGHVNDAEGRPFVGRGGMIFDSILRSIGVRRSDVYISNAVKCWPPDNRKPKPAEMKACASYLRKEIELIAPSIIIAMGATAFHAITGKQIALRTEHGRIEFVNGIPVCAIFHPNGLRYIKGGRDCLVGALQAALTEVGLTSAAPHNEVQDQLQL